MRTFEDNTLVMEGVRIVYRNFRGEGGMYNPEGDRNFAVLLDDEVAERLENDGWKVKYMKVREEGDVPQPYLPVAIYMGGKRPPEIWLITMFRGQQVKTRLDEETMFALDYVDITNVDLTVRNFEWSFAGKTGHKTALNDLWVTVRPNHLAQKYEEVLELDELPARAGAIEDVVDGQVVSSNDILELEG